MELATAGPEEIVSYALRTIRESGTDQLNGLDTVETAVYVTDAEGHIVYFNPACIRFSGRTPVTGSDRWCVSWKLYAEDGTAIPHDRCPMAVAIKESRTIRNQSAIAERPDGSRVPFLPFPTPVRDDSGAIRGAVNVLVEGAQGTAAHRLHQQAERCRRLARGIDDGRTRDTLTRLADDYESKAQSVKLA